MKKTSYYFLILLSICSGSCNLHRQNPLAGVWMLVSAHGENAHSLQGISKFPAGFRFYSLDSVEVYSDLSMLNRFSSYVRSKDSLVIQGQAKILPWKSKITQEKDSLRIFLRTDTLVYYRALNDNIVIKG